VILLVAFGVDALAKFGDLEIHRASCPRAIALLVAVG
jgi:hypothetical protein